MTEQPKRTRRWFQFSLRALLVTVTGLAILLGLWANRARKQRRAVELIRSLGGNVLYEHQRIPFTESGYYPDQMPRPVWLSDMLGEDYLATIAMVQLIGPQFSDEELEEIVRDLPRLKKLGLWETQITDVGLAKVAQLRSLETLTIQNGNMTPAGFEGLHDELPEAFIQGLFRNPDGSLTDMYFEPSRQ